MPRNLPDDFTQAARAQTRANAQNFQRRRRSPERRESKQETALRLATNDPEVIRRHVTQALLEPWLRSLTSGVMDGQRWAMRLYAECAKLVNAQPQVAVAFFARFGFKDETDAVELLSRVREAEAQPMGQTVNQAATLLRDWLVDHPEDKPRLMGVAFGAREVSHG